ncbi:hypothetical protein [Desulforhopalus sp. 52FAK]
MTNRAVPLLTILTCYLFFAGNTLARQPIIPDSATMEKVHQEISTMVQSKEFDSTETLSLYRCYGKMYLEPSQTTSAEQIQMELEKFGITIERVKVRQKDNRSYMILSLLSHDKQELTNMISEIKSNANTHVIIKSSLETGDTIFKNLGCTELLIHK